MHRSPLIILVWTALGVIGVLAFGLFTGIVGDLATFGVPQ